MLKKHALPTVLALLLILLPKPARAADSFASFDVQGSVPSVECTTVALDDVAAPMSTLPDEAWCITKWLNFGWEMAQLTGQVIAGAGLFAACVTGGLGACALAILDISDIPDAFLDAVAAAEDLGDCINTPVPDPNGFALLARPGPAPRLMLQKPAAFGWAV